MLDGTKIIELDVHVHPGKVDGNLEALKAFSTQEVCVTHLATNVLFFQKSGPTMLFPLKPTAKLLLILMGTRSGCMI